MIPVEHDDLSIVDRRYIRAWLGRQQRDGASALPIGRHKPAKQNHSSPTFLNFHFDFGDFAPVNPKKCDAGIRHRPIGKRRFSDRKLMTGEYRPLP